MRRRINNTVRPVPRQREMIMVRIKFLDKETQNEGLGFLVTRFSGSTFRSGETIVPPEAAAMLAAENFRFKVLGRATDKQMATFRSHLFSVGVKRI
jgi:hypothetical protein